MKAIFFRTAPVILLLCLCFAGSFAETENNLFVRIPNNPVSNAITALAQDQNGFLWLGTDKGLVRFDGIEYKIFRGESFDSVRMINSYIRNLYLDSKGILWIGTNEGAVIYNPEAGRFIRLNIVPANTTVKSFMELPGEEVLIGTNKSLLIANRKGEVSALSSGGLNPLAGENVTHMAKDLYGNIWLANNNGFTRIDIPDTLSAQKDNLVFTFYPQKFNLGYFSIDPMNNIWFCDGETIKRTKATQNDRLEKIETIRTEFDSRAIFHDKNERMTLLNRRYESIHLLFHDETGRIVSEQKYQLNPLSPNHMSDNISSIIRDKKGNFWFGTRDGLFVYDDSSLKNFHTITEKKGSTDGLSHSVISEILEDSQKNIWIGTSIGLNKLSFPNGKPYIEQFSDSHDINSFRLNNRVQALAEGDDGILWVGSKLGIAYFDPEKKHFFARAETDNFLSKINAMFVRTMFKDKQGRIWIGFVYGGLICFDSASGKFLKITTPRNDFNKQDIWAVHEDIDGSIWFGSKRDGLFRFQPDSIQSSGMVQHMRQYNVSGRKNSSTSTDWITSLFLDFNRSLWVGTSRGLYKYNRDSNTFQRIILSSPSEEPYICGIKQDLQGNYWISTTTGVHRYNDQKGFSTFFEFNQGDFARVEYSFGSCLTDDGKILLGGIKGVVYFDPSKIAVDTTLQNRIFITDFRIGNQEITPDGIHLKNDINTDNRITMKYPENQFTLAFSSLHLNNPQYIRFAYMLEGVDDNWIYTEWNRNYAGYTNLSPGKYRLKIRSTNETGSWLDNIRTIDLHILPPWYMTYWFYALAALICLTVLFFIFRILYSRNHYRQAEQINAIKQTYFINVTHSFKTPLMLLQTPLNQLIRHGDQMTIDERDMMLNLMNKNVKRISNLIRQVTEFRKIEQKKTSLYLVEMNIIPFLNEICNSFQPMFHSKQIPLNFESNIPMVMVTIDPEKIETILFNLLSNAYRFTPEGGKVTVRCMLEPTDYKLYISVSDTGIGIEPAHRQKVFERFWKAKTTENNFYSNGAGIGLSLSKELVELHHGEIFLQSHPGAGSTFTFTLRLGSKHFEKLYVEKETDPIQPLFTNTYVEAEQESYSIVDNSNRTDLPLVYMLSDTTDTLNLTRYILKDYRMMAHSSFDTLKETVLHTPPNLVIVDMAIHHNPPMLAFCKEVKSDPQTSHIPIMIFTPEDSKEENIIGYEVGVDAIIEKPFGTEYLLARINQLVRSRVELKEKLQLDLIITPNPEEEESGDRKFINQVMIVIEKNMSNESFNLQEFAKAMNSSKSVLHSRLQNLTQQSPIEFLRTVRLKKAAQLLALNAYNITQVSYMVGFSDSRYFSTCFKKQFGMTPREYIKKYKQEENIEDQLKSI